MAEYCRGEPTRLKADQAYHSGLHTSFKPWLCLTDLVLQILLESQRDFTHWQHIVTSSVDLLEDGEVRVRDAISSCVRLLAAQHGAQVVQSMQPAICQSIESNWVSVTRPSLTVLHVT